MDTFLPEGFEPGRARPQMSRPARQSRLCVEAGGVYYPVLRRWATGFAVEAQDMPARGGPAVSSVVNLYEGSEHLHGCLVTGVEDAGGERIFTVKRAGALNYATAAVMEGDAV